MTNTQLDDLYPHNFLPEETGYGYVSDECVCGNNMFHKIHNVNTTSVEAYKAELIQKIEGMRKKFGVSDRVQMCKCGNLPFEEEKYCGSCRRKVIIKTETWETESDTLYNSALSDVLSIIKGE